MNHIKTFALTIAMAVAALSATAADITPSDNYITRKVSTGAFDAVRTNTSLDIVYTVGPRSVEIYAPDNLAPYIKVSVNGSELVVSYKENMNIRSSHKSYVKVSAPDVTSFTTASAGDISIKSPIKQKNKTVELRVLSAGDIKAENIEANVIKLRTNSAGDIETGDLRAAEITLLVNSAGDIETGTVAAVDGARVIINSAGDIEIPEIVAGKEVSLVTNSAGDMEIKKVSAPSASINVNSAGHITVSSLKADNVSATTGSTGNIDLSGVCSAARLIARSIGDIDARNLKAKDVTASVSSTGSIKCQALKSLDASRSGNGEIRYAGKPSSLTVSSTRKGGVKPL